MGGVLAIDHGTKRTGFASADALRLGVAPLEVFHGPGNGPELLAHVDRLLAERQVSVVLVGHPVDPAGRPGPRAREVETFAAELRRRHPELEVVLHDEGWTTKEAEARLREAGHHGDARRARRDSWSAWVLLEDWIASGEPRGGAR